MIVGTKKKHDRIPAQTPGTGRAVSRASLPPAEARAVPTPRGITAIRMLLAGAIGALLYFAHIAFVPVALSLLLALILSGPVEMLHRIHVPRVASAVLIMLAIVGLAAGMLDFLSEPAQHWFAEAPHTMRVIGRKVRPLAQFIARVDELRNSAGSIAAASHPAAPAAPAPAPTPSTGASTESAPALLFEVTTGVVVSTVTVIILTLFLLAGGPPMLARMTSALLNDINSAHVICVIEKVRREVGRFYVTSALINVGLGLATGCAMMACGMPNPFLWGTMVAVFNFVPYAGPIASLILLTCVAFVSFDGFAHVVAVAGSFLGLAAIEGQVVQPLLVGHRLQLNPMLVFLALWFGGLFWGIAGIVLATPALATLKVIAENSAHGKPLVKFLSPTDSTSEDTLVLADDENCADAFVERDAAARHTALT